jgi:hypothetical protein
MKRSQCEICGKQDHMNFRCNDCGGYFCDKHHLPENHNCANKPNVPPPYVQPPKATSYEPLSLPINHPSLKQQIKLQLIKKVVVGFIKFLFFSIFTVATGLPFLFYSVMLTLPEYLSTLELIYLFNHIGLLFWVIIPNLAYVIIWFFTIYSILRNRAKRWYHLLLLILGLWSWWGLLRVITIQTILGGIFG